MHTFAHGLPSQERSHMVSLYSSTPSNFFSSFLSVSEWHGVQWVVWQLGYSHTQKQTIMSIQTVRQFILGLYFVCSLQWHQRQKLHATLWSESNPLFPIMILYPLVFRLNWKCKIFFFFFFSSLHMQPMRLGRWAAWTGESLDMVCVTICIFC